LTGDVDVTVDLRKKDPMAFVAAMGAAGFDLRVRDIDEFVRRTRVLPFVHRPSGVPVDVVLAGPGLEQEFLRRAIPVDIAGTVLPVISPEDLIVTKVLAGRPKDLEDIHGILRSPARRLDLARIRRTLALLGEAIAQSDLPALFERELVRARKRGGRSKSRRSAARKDRSGSSRPRSTRRDGPRRRPRR